jgi:hypothetical protein
MQNNLVAEAGNCTTDISDSLPNYLLVINSKDQNITIRTVIRSYSDKNKQAFIGEIQQQDWASTFGDNNVNRLTAYNNSIFTLQYAFNRNFP